MRIVLVITMYVLFALTFVIGSVAMQHAAPLFFIGVRMLMTAALLLGFLFVTQKAYRFKRRDLTLFLLLGIVHIAIPYLGEFWALQYLSAAKVSLLWSLSPFITAGFAWVLFRERLTWLKTVGLVLGVIGFIPLMFAERLSQVTCGLACVSWADLSLLSAIVSAAYAWNLFKRLVQQGYSPLVINAWSMLIGGAISLLFSPLCEVWHPVPVTNWAITLMCLSSLVLVGGIICYNLYGYLLRFYSTTFLSFAGGIVPFCTALLQWLLLGQLVSWSFVLSFCIIMIGLYIFYKEELRQGYFPTQF